MRDTTILIAVAWVIGLAYSLVAPALTGLHPDGAASFAFFMTICAMCLGSVSEER